MCSYVCLTHTHIKVKSMQIFKKPVAKATQGDRAAGVSNVCLMCSATYVALLVCLMCV
jgi:hypothetical protein